MPDVVSPEKRSQMMAAIRAKNTKPEILIRRGLHRLGFRFQLHRKDLPGKPDLVFPRHRAVVFVHGCFWHGHDCQLFKWPKSRSEFWQRKIRENQERDQTAIAQLISTGWRVSQVWECATRGPGRLDSALVLKRVADWLHSLDQMLELRGRL